MSPATDVHGLLSAIPASIPVIGPGIAGLVHAGSPSSAPFLVEGRRCCAHGSGRGTEARISFDDWVAIDAVDASLGDTVNVLQAPGVVRRERAGPRGTATETLLVASTLPLAVIQWTAPVRCMPERVRVVLGRSDPPAGADTSVAGRTTTHASGIVRRGREGSCLVVASVPAPERVELAPDGESVVFFMAPRHEPGLGVVTVVAAAGTPAEVRAALAAAAHAPAHAVRAARPPDEAGITFETGVREIDEGFAWARVRLHGLTARLQGGSSRTGLAAGLAAVAAGDEECARDALATLRRGTPEHALLAARIASTLGDPAAALSAAEAWAPDASGLWRAPHGQSERALVGVAAGALADGLRYAAPDALIEDLRRLGATALEPRAPERAADGARRRLPMADRPPLGPDLRDPLRAEALWWSRLLAGTPEVDPPPAAGVAEDLRRAAAAFVANPDAGWMLWREALAKGMAEGPAGPCSWDAIAERPGNDSIVTAELILAAAHGLLGAAPDAPVGRLKLAPRLPSHLRSLHVRGLPLGSARLAMTYERVGVTHRFTLTPEVAAVPPLIVFEPSVPGAILGARVDGHLAELDVKPVAGSGKTGAVRTIVPVQLPLDAVRTLEIDARSDTP